MLNSIIKISNNRYYWIKVLFDGLLLFVAFLTAYFFKRGHVFIETGFLKFLPLFLFCWLVSYLPTNKFRKEGSGFAKLDFKPFIVSGGIFAGLLSLSLYFLKWYELSRLIVFGSVAIWLLLEFIILSWLYHVPTGEEKRDSFPFYFFVFECFLLLSCFMGGHYFKKGSFDLKEEYEILLGVMCFSWIFVGIFIHKFNIPKSKNYLKVIWPFIKSSFIVLCVVSFFIFGSRVEQFPRMMIFGSLGVFSFMELLIVSFYYVYFLPKSIDAPDVNYFTADIIEEQETIKKVVDKNSSIKEKYSVPGDKYTSKLFMTKLQKIYLKKMPDVYKFVDEVMDIASLDIVSSEVISSGNPYNVEILPDNSLDLFINLHELNDFRRVNQYLIEVNRAIKDGGVFISKFEPKENRRIMFLKKYPVYLANTLYFFDFIWKRCFPKLPFFQKLYFSISKGRNRVLSLTEGLGRLYFCGFEIIAMEEIDSFIFFAAKKAKEPANDPNPSYSPVFKMKRVGRYGKPIYVYKFRTMYPYSEYLQGFVTKQIGYGTKGKVKDDFRVTAWGKFLRRFWLDELPQLINLFRGELALVSVRPLSEGFLSNYPEDLKKARLNFKPGCFPPYVAYKMQAVDQYLDSERIYLAEKQKHPFLTDVKVLFVGLYNIATNKIRSE